MAWYANSTHYKNKAEKSANSLDGLSSIALNLTYKISETFLQLLGNTQVLYKTAFHYFMHFIWLSLCSVPRRYL